MSIIQDFIDEYKNSSIFYVHDNVEADLRCSLENVIKKIINRLDDEVITERDRYKNSQDETEMTYTEHRGFVRGLLTAKKIISDGK